MKKIKNKKLLILFLALFIVLGGFFAYRLLQDENKLTVTEKKFITSNDNKVINVTPKEYEILSYLIKNKDIAISREQLLSNVWGFDFFGDDRTVDTHIKMLRNNLGKYRDNIVTVRGFGYKYVEEKE